MKTVIRRGVMAGPLLGLFLLASPLYAQTMSFDQVLQRVVDHYPSLRSTEYQVEKARQETGLPIVTEVVDPRDVSWVAEFADVLQIGTRNMQNFSLLKEVGKSGRPVLLKRGMYSTLEEWLNCAEYI